MQKEIMKGENELLRIEMDYQKNSSSFWNKMIADIKLENGFLVEAPPQKKRRKEEIPMQVKEVLIKKNGACEEGSILLL